MKVVLLKNLPKIGQAGDVIDIKAGYGANYLIPNKLAALPKSPAAEQLIKELNQKNNQNKKQLEQSKLLAESLQGQSVTIAAKAGADGRLYGSITKNDIATALHIDKLALQLDQPIRQLGTHEVKINFGHEMVALVTLKIVADK